MEYFDILNYDGIKTGIIKSRDEVHRDGDWHKSVHIWILNSNNELLIQRRSAKKDTHPNEWDISVAGHLSAGEASITGALKETKEEIGLDLQPDDYKLLFTITNQSTPRGFINNEYNDVYLVRKDLDLNKLILEDDVAEVKFIKVKELKKIIECEGKGFVMHDEEYRRLFDYLKDNRI
jgi:isopentenyl-diphosphate Delta-isomerase